MPTFRRQQTRSRGQRLQATFLNQLEENIRANEVIATYEHNLDGTHNALEVTRGIGNFIYDGINDEYDLQGNNAVISSATKNGTGDITITLGAGYVPSRMGIRASVIHNGGENLPYSIMARRLSATQVRVWIRRLEILTGNVWNAADADFSLAVHAERYVNGSGSSISAMLAFDPGEALGAEATGRWNTMVANQALQYERLLVEHTAAGEHDLREVAKAAGSFVYTPGTTSYGATFQEGFGAITRVSQGVVELELDPPLSTPLNVFTSPDYARSDSGEALDLVVAVSPNSQHSSSAIRVCLYKYNPTSNLWARADADFAVAVHGA